MSSSGHQTVDMLRKVYGPPPEGFEDYIGSCKLKAPFVSPTTVPDLCFGYQTPDGLLLHDIMLQPYYELRTMVARPSDLLIASSPKTGTTWLQEICYLISHNSDFKKAKSSPLEERMPFMEIPVMGSKAIAQMPNPRILKTHLPYHLLPESFLNCHAKIVYITRNPKDTVVSFYHFFKFLGFISYRGSLEDFVDIFVKGEVLYDAFHDNVLGFWKRRNEDNILFLTYEGLQKDFKASIRQIANFLDKLLTDEQVDQIADHCSFGSMSTNVMTNYSHHGSVAQNSTEAVGFMRKGKVGDWKNHLTSEMSQKIDDYVEKHFKDSGLTFEYEI